MTAWSSSIFTTRSTSSVAGVRTPATRCPGYTWSFRCSNDGLLGTHQGAVSMIHLPYYLDEFTFRFNRRNSKSRGKLFYRLMQQAVATPPTTYPQMAAQTTFRKVLTGRNR